jgi:hypothetical protein
MNTKPFYGRPARAKHAFLLACCTLLLAACDVMTPSAAVTSTVAEMPTALPAASPAVETVDTPTPQPEPAIPAAAAVLELALPDGWAAADAIVPSTGGRSLVASDANGAILTVLALPAGDVSLARYVEDGAALLRQDGLDVARAGVVYDLRDDGVPVGILEFASAAGETGMQWIVLAPQNDELWTVTLAASSDQGDAAKADVAAWLAALALPEP